MWTKHINQIASMALSYDHLTLDTHEENGVIYYPSDINDKHVARHGKVEISLYNSFSFIFLSYVL